MEETADRWGQAEELFYLKPVKVVPLGDYAVDHDQTKEF